MKVLFVVANQFTNDPRVYNEAHFLIGKGYDVTVLAWDRGGKQKEVENIDGIRVVRFKNSRYMDALRYDILRLKPWWRKGLKIALNLCRKEKIEVVHCHDQDTLPIGIKLKKKLKIKLVYDAHEIWGYMAEKDIPKWLARRFLKKERKWVNYADRIVTVSQPIKEYLSGFSSRPITIVMNCKSLASKSYEPPHNQRFTIIYIGSLGQGRALMELVEALKMHSDVQCFIGGIGKPEFVNQLKKRCEESSNVKFLGRVPFHDVIPITKKADAVFCMFDPENRNNAVGLPNKVFEAMVCGRPVIVTKDIYSGKLIDKCNCGIAINYDVTALSYGISKLKNDGTLCETYGRNALKSAIDSYNWEAQASQLFEMYEGMKGDG